MKPKKPKLATISTIYPAGYIEWLNGIYSFVVFHNWLPAKVMNNWSDHDGWLQAFHRNLYDSEALDMVMGNYKPPKKRTQNRASQYQKEVDRFMYHHQLGFVDYEDESEWSVNDIYLAGLSPLTAVDIILGYAEFPLPE